MNNVIKAVFWKENKIFLKSIFPICAMYFLILVYVFDNTIKSLIINYSDFRFLTKYIVLFTILLVIIEGGMTFNMSMGIDIKEKVLEPLIPLTNKIDDIWISKVFYSSLVGMVFGVCGDVFLIARLKIVNSNLDIYYIIRLIFFIGAGVLLALVYNVINSLLTWIIKYEIIILVITLCMPALCIYMLLRYLYLFETIKASQLLIYLIIGFIGVFLLFVFRIIINIIPKEWYFK